MALGLPEIPADGEIEWSPSHLRVHTPGWGRGPVSTTGPDGSFYDYEVGAFGILSTGRDWDSLAGAAHRCALKVVGNKKVYLLLFPTIQFPRRKEIFGKWLLAVVFPFNNRIPISEAKFQANGDLSWPWCSLNIPERRCGPTRCKTPTHASKAQLLKGYRKPP